MNRLVQFILKYWIIILPLPVMVGFVIYRKLRTKKMIEKLIPFIQKQEGGLSRDPDDNASSNPCPYPYKGKTGYHTNKGITWTTFTSMAKVIGYSPTAENFFKMPFKIWFDILKNGYMKPYNLDEIDHLPRIQAVIITWAWGSGVAGSERYLARFQRKQFGIQDNDIKPIEITRNFNQHVNKLNEKKIFLQLCEQRAFDFSQMSDFPKYKNGWLNRLNEFKNLFK